MSDPVKRLAEGRDFRYIKSGLELSDHRKVLLPPVLIEGVAPDSPYKATLDAENGVGKGCNVWRLDDHLFVLWGIMHGQNAAYFCRLRPAPHSSVADYLDTAVIRASQFAQQKHSVRAKVSSVDAVKETLLHVSVHIANAWHVSENHKNYKADEINYVLNLSDGRVKIVSRRDTTKDELA